MLSAPLYFWGRGFSMENRYLSLAHIPSPCRQCTKETGRHPGCHGKCKKYISFRKELDEKSAEIRKAKEDYYGPRPKNYYRFSLRRNKKNGEV